MARAKQRLESLAEKNELQIHELEFCLWFCFEG